jgi:hypothetical protein
LGTRRRYKLRHDRWFHYPEPSGDRSNVEASIERADQAQATLIPKRAKPGQSIHVILEIKDDGEPALYSYRRLIFTVAGK